MSKTPISPLRARMIEDMSVRKFGEKTQKDYIQYVKTLRSWAGRRPRQAAKTSAGIRYIKARKVSRRRA